MTEMTMVEALRDALQQEMERDPRVHVLGEDVGNDGGIFRITEGLLESFGEGRVMDTPLAESGIIGFAIGMAVTGLRPVAEMQFSGFSYMALHQMENHAARLRWRSRGRHTVPMVVRMPYGAGVRALEHHSESREVVFAHTPGLKMVVPSGPRNAKALLLAAIRDADPVVFFEPKRLYRSIKQEVPQDAEVLPIGRAQVAREGRDVTLIAFGAMLQPTLEAATRLREEDGVEAEVIDLLSLYPLDHTCFESSVRKTGRAVVVHEAPRTFGPAGEIVARLVKESFLYLEAPVVRVTGFDTPVPYFAREDRYLPSTGRIVAAARETLRF